MAFDFSSLPKPQSKNRDIWGLGPSRFLFFLGLTPSSLSGPDGRPFVVLWRPEGLDCRVPIRPETWNGTEPKTSASES